jgi:hypothetical protein
MCVYISALMHIEAFVFYMCVCISTLMHIEALVFDMYMHTYVLNIHVLHA